MKLFINAKCSDLFSYYIDDLKGNEFGFDGYVPGWMPGEHYGDYVELEIDPKTGTILNWKKDAYNDLKDILKKHGSKQ